MAAIKFYLDQAITVEPLVLRSEIERFEQGQTFFVKQNNYPGLGEICFFGPYNTPTLDKATVAIFVISKRTKQQP